MEQALIDHSRQRFTLRSHLPAAWESQSSFADDPGGITKTEQIRSAGNDLGKAVKFTFIGSCDREGRAFEETCAIPNSIPNKKSNSCYFHRWRLRTLPTRSIFWRRGVIHFWPGVEKVTAVTIAQSPPMRRRNRLPTQTMIARDSASPPPHDRSWHGSSRLAWISAPGHGAIFQALLRG